MKKAIFTLLLWGIFYAGQATTYYWIGGIGTASVTTFTNGTVWTTDPVGRAAIGGTITIGSMDVFIFDGSNFGGATPATGAVTLTSTSITGTLAQLKIINGANVTLTRAAAGSTAMTIGGDGTVADDLVIDGTSTLTLGGGAYDCSFQVALGTTATASISGNLYLSQLSATTHTRSYITAPVAGAVVFQTGGSCYITDSLATSGFNGSVAGSIVFKTGASLYYYSGRSPIGSSSTLQFTVFQPGSNCYFMASNVSYLDGVTPYSSSSWTNTKLFSNLFIQNGASITADGPTYKIDNFTIASGSTFTTHTSGQTAVLGNLTVNGTYTYPAAGSSNVLVIGGTGTQTISGTGTIKVPTLTVSDVSTVALNTNIYDSVGCNIIGKINFGTSKITGVGTFSARVNYNGTGETYSGATATAGAYQLTASSTPTPSSLNGLSVNDNGAGIIAPNTVVTGFTSAGIIYLSQPILATGNITLLSFGSGACTLTTANAGGLVGCVTSTGIQSFNSGVNVIYTTATTTPFPTTGTTFKPGNITFNANATTNGVAYVSGALTLNSTKLIIRPADTIRINTGGSIAGTMSASNYIATDVSGNNAGVLQVDSFTTATTLPIGSVTNYMPVTLTPASVSSFAANVFEGITANGTPAGTAFTITQKAGVVNAVWNINRVTANTDNCTVSMKWPASLEGSSFTGYSNVQVGIGRYDTTALAWATAIGTGDNTANTATASFNTFGAFGVGKTGTVLPVQFIGISATYADGAVTVTWQTGTDIDISGYTVERSGDGSSFTESGTITPNASKQYSWVDAQPLPGNNFYRIKATGKSGDIQYSTTIRVNTASMMNNAIHVYPNPVQNKTLSIQLSGLAINEYSLMLVTATGQTIFTQSLGTINNNQSLSIPLTGAIPQGMYFVIIKSNNVVLHQQVFIQ